MPRVLHKGPVPFTPFGIKWGVTKQMDSIKAGIFSMGFCQLLSFSHPSSSISGNCTYQDKYHSISCHLLVSNNISNFSLHSLLSFMLTQTFDLWKRLSQFHFFRRQHRMICILIKHIHKVAELLKEISFKHYQTQEPLPKQNSHPLTRSLTSEQKATSY